MLFMMSGIGRGIVAKPSRSLRYQRLLLSMPGQSLFRSAICRSSIFCDFGFTIEPSQQWTGLGWKPSPSLLPRSPPAQRAFRTKFPEWISGQAWLITMAPYYAFLCQSRMRSSSNWPLGCLYKCYLIFSCGNICAISYFEMTYICQRLLNFPIF